MKNYQKILNFNGFVLLPKIFESSSIERAKNGLWEVIKGRYETGIEPENRFWNPGDNSKNIIKIDKPHLSNKALLDLITTKSFGQYIAKITNSIKIQIWHTQAVWKPAGGGENGNAGWHRDSQYWPYWDSSGLYTAWIALSDVTIKSGPVKFIEKSNRWKSLRGLDFFDKEVKKQELIISNTHKKFNVSDAILKKGQVSIHDALTYHSSGPNESKRPRVGMVVHFRNQNSRLKKPSADEVEYLKQLKDYQRCPIIYEA